MCILHNFTYCTGVKSQWASDKHIFQCLYDITWSNQYFPPSDIALAFFSYSSEGLLVFLCPETFNSVIMLSNRITLDVPDDGDHRKRHAHLIGYLRFLYLHVYCREQL